METVHSREHHGYVDSLAELRPPALKDEGQKWDSVYFNRHSSRAARMAAGSCTVVVHVHVHVVLCFVHIALLFIPSIERFDVVF